MPNQTKNLGLYTFLESDAVDFEQINENFEKIDKTVICFETGTKTASLSESSEGTIVWRYKKFTDGTIELTTKIESTSIKSDSGSAAPYSSGDVKMYFPFSLSEIYDVQTHLCSSNGGWISDVTERSVLEYLTLKVMSVTQESSATYKQIFVNVKGVLGNG